MCNVNMNKSLIIISLIIIVILSSIFIYEADEKDTSSFKNSSQNTDEETLGNWYDITKIRGVVRHLVEEKKFSQLEDMVHQARVEKLRLITETWVLRDLYNAIPYSLEDYDSIYQLVAEWRDHSPDSNIPDIIEARALYSYAWKVRREHSRSTVSNKQHLGFKDYLSKAWDSTILAEEKGPVDLEVCTIKTTLLFVLFSDKTLAKEQFYKCAKIEPGYIHLYITTANYLQSKWTGSNRELLEFVEKSADDTAYIFGDGLYALLVSSLTDDNSKSFRIFIEDGGIFSWQRAMKGFDDIIEKNGKSSYILHMYGYCAMLAFDNYVFAKILKEIGIEWDESKKNTSKKNRGMNII